MAFCCLYCDEATKVWIVIPWGSAIKYQYRRSKQLDIIKGHICFPTSVGKLWGRYWIDACQALFICNINSHLVIAARLLLIAKVLATLLKTPTHCQAKRAGALTRQQ